MRVLGLDPGRDGARLRQRIGAQLQRAALPDRLKVWEALDLYASLYPDQADPQALLSTRLWKFVRGQRVAEGGGSCQALGSLRYSPQAQSKASSGEPACSPVGRMESS